MRLSSKGALILFICMVVVLFAQAVWWIIFMAKATGEKVDLARELNASPERLAQIHQREVNQQIMLGSEGVFFLLLILVGAWLIYRALVRTEELKFHQQNFLAAVTHELKTPLASIELYLDTLQSPKIDPAKKDAIIPRMREDVSRLEKMVGDILDAGRFERSGYHLSKSTFDLSGLLNTRLDALGRVATSVPLAVERDIEPHLSYYGDPAALGRAIDAIMENCLKYHNPGGITIRASLKTEHDRIVLSIADQGIGFERGEEKQLFDRFYRVGDEMTRRQSGTGLGLYLCREIVKAHGGTIDAFSEGPGRGARFTISLKKTRDENDSVG